MKILTLYDGTIQSKTALRYGLREAKKRDGELIVLQVFQSSLFVDYDAGPRAEELARAETDQHRRDAETLVREAGQQGISVRVLSMDGDTVEEALRIAGSEQVDLVLTTPRYKAIAKTAACPVRLVPGTILVPVDNSDTLLSDIDAIVQEAEASGSKVMLLGIVPVHLYSVGEKKEFELVKKGAAETVKKVKRLLTVRGLEVSDSMRSGYPDEEILKAAEEFGVSLIMLPAGGKTPSELTKAAAILLDEPERVHMPILILATA